MTYKPKVFGVAYWCLQGANNICDGCDGTSPNHYWRVGRSSDVINWEKLCDKCAHGYLGLITHYVEVELFGHTGILYNQRAVDTYMKCHRVIEPLAKLKI